MKIKLLFLLLFLSFSSFGQLATYNITSTTNVVNPSVPNSTKDANITTASDIVRGADLTGESGGINSINSSGFPTTASTTGTSYYEFTLTPNTLYNFDFSTLSFNAQRSGTGPSTIELFTINGSDAPISRGTNTLSTSSALKTFSLNFKNNGAPVTFRIYGYSATGSGGTFRISTSLNVNGTLPLPITLISFTGQNNNGQSLLNWQTTSESNFSHFEVMRSFDAKGFETIGRIEGKGSESDRSDYRFVDERPKPGNNYYKLKQVDLDGTEEFSKIINVSSSDYAEVLVYPNPGFDEISLRNIEKEEIETIQIRNKSGRLLKIRGNESLSIKIGDLSDSNLILEIRLKNGSSITKNIIKL